ncbi:MAG: hypothetical protein FJZ43_04115 [Candidatus Staskawiczbacteria bacterium]|nr:hypothetical protein [Candidatus Staskawiczbacteria bacterium]
MTYNEIYNQILSSLKTDNFPIDNQVWAAKIISDSLWQVNLMLNSKRSGSLPSVKEAIKTIISSRIC